MSDSENNFEGETVRILSHATSEVKRRGAVPSLKDIGSTISEVSAEHLKHNLSKAVKTWGSIIEETTKDLENFDLKEFKVSFAVDGKGEISVLGTLTGSVEAKSSFEVTFTPKSKK